jgi:hypothetical protein
VLKIGRISGGEKRMINKQDKHIDLEFGKGDICVNSGYFIDGNDIKVGMVAFSNQSPREIGVEGDIKAGQECKVGDFPVILTFTKKESIDVVVKALLETKEYMD